MSGSKVSRRIAIESKCHECMAHYADGKSDCQVVTCPLYLFMPYRKQKPVLDWQRFSPRRIGLVAWEDIRAEEHAKNTPEQSNPHFVGIPISNSPHESAVVKKEGFPGQKWTTGPTGN